MDLQRAMLILSNQFSDMGSGREYSSVLIGFPPEAAQSIVNYARYRINSAALYTDEAEHIYGLEFTPHVTAFYGLHTCNPLDVAEVVEAGKIGPFEIALGVVSLFNEPAYDVVKVDVESAELQMLHTAIGSLPNSNEYPEFVPHLTLAYVKPGWANDMIGDDHFSGLKFKIDRVDFSGYNGKITTLPLFGVTLDANQASPQKE